MNLQDGLDFVEEIYSMERLTHYLMTKARTLDERWEKWTGYRSKDGLWSE